MCLIEGSTDILVFVIRRTKLNYEKLYKDVNDLYVYYRCGGGTKKRTRQNELPGRCKSIANFNCRHSTEQTVRCNQQCPNGGSPNAKGCSCRPGWLGICCTTGKIEYCNSVCLY